MRRWVEPSSTRIRHTRLSLRPFDYVSDQDGVVHVVRTGGHTGGEVIVHPAYKIEGRELRRAKQTGLHVASSDSRDWLLDLGCRILPVESLALLREWDAAPLTPGSPGLPGQIRAFSRRVSVAGARLYLYGSRLIGVARGSADWDLLYVPGELGLDPVAQAVAADPSLTFLDQAELTTLFTLPVGNDSVSASDLQDVLQAGLKYLRFDGVRVDLIIRYPEWDGEMPQHRPCRKDVSACGVIAPGAGRSYAMPRDVTLVDPAGQTSTVRHLCWFLPGLEQLAGRLAGFTGLVELAPRFYWFSSRHGKLQLGESHE